MRRSMRDCQQLSAETRQFLTVLDQSVTARRHYGPMQHENDTKDRQRGRRPDDGGNTNSVYKRQH